MMSTGAVHAVEQVGVFTPKMLPVDDLGPGEIGFITAAIKTVADCKVGDTITDDRSPAAEPLPGFKPSRAGGVVRPVPGRCRRFREAARQPGQAAAERRELPLRPGNLGGAGLRLPLRLPRPAAPGNHPGAAVARVRPRPDRHRPHRGLSRAPHQRRDGGTAQPGRHAGRQRHRPYRGAVDQGDHHGAGRISRRGADADATNGAASRRT